MADHSRRFAAATARNREPILAVLRRVFPEQGTVLEIASGTGEHAVHFARNLPGIVWQPSDNDDDALASIEAWREREQLPNLRDPVRIDVTADIWPLQVVDAVFCANMIHIAPWSCCLGLMRGVGRCLRKDGVLVLYGPFRVAGQHISASNERFDAELRERDPSWGVRELADVTAQAELHGLHLHERLAMPANNFSLVFHRGS
jgi:SAM-dependent methyltransferase